MDNIIDIELTSRSTRRDQKLWQYDYGQVLRIAGKEFPKVTEVQFSLQQSGGHTLDRIGTSNNGLLTVQIPNELLQNKGTTSDYTIYAFVYLSGDGFGNTKYMIQLPVESRPEPTDPSEDPSIDPSIFKDAVNAVNASAERAEAAEKSAKESADKAKEYAESAGKSKEDVEKARDSAISAIGIEKESALRGIESKIVESLQKIQSQTEASQNSIKQSIADATQKKTELDGAISNATDAKGNLDKAVQSAGNAKTELDTSVGKAGEAKTALDSSIRSSGEKRLALDATVKQANAVDASLKEQIGSAEQIQANVEQIAKNKADISSLIEDTAVLQKHQNVLVGSETGNPVSCDDAFAAPLCGLNVYGKSTQDGTPSPDNPVPIDSAGDGGSVAMKVTGKNILDMRNSRESITNSGVTYARNADYSFTRTGTATDSIGNVWMAGGYIVKPNADLSNVFCVLLKGVTYSIKDCVLIACSPDGKALVARNENFVPTQDMYITGVRNENFIINKTYNDIVYPAAYVGAKALQYEPYREQLLTLPTPTGLPGIPVTSGGNYTDQNGQQWVCDEVDLERGVKVQRIDKTSFDNTKTLAEQNAILATPVETPLTPVEIAAYKALTAYGPDTVVQASDGAGIKLDYQRDVNLVVKNLEDAIASMTTI